MWCRASAAAALGLLLAACSTINHPTLRVERAVTLADSLAVASNASFDAYAKRPDAKVKDPAAFEEMRNHLRTLYTGVTVSHSFLGRDNQFVDCIPIEQQPGLRNPRLGPLTLQRDPPKPTLDRPLDGSAEQGGSKAPSIAKREFADATLKPGVRDQFNAEMFCPAATIPMRRVTLDEMVRFATLRAFLSKSPFGGKSDLDRRPDRPGQQNPADTDHYYARGVHFVDNFGGDSWLNVWSPIVEKGHMSLSQIWVVGDASPKQTVEAGWQVYPDKWSSDKAALFIFYTTDNYDDGCYNLDCSGFVQLANNVYLGSGFDRYSTRDGEQRGFNLQYKRGPDGTWWLFYKGPGDYIVVGYYPHSLFGDGFLASKSNKIAWGGEDTGSPSACEMGSGSLPTGGFGRAAYQDTIFYIDTGTVSQWADLTKQEIPSDCYKADISNFSSTRGRTHLYFGGPKCK
jgi:hypothetical protein